MDTPNLVYKILVTFPVDPAHAHWKDFPVPTAAYKCERYLVRDGALIMWNVFTDGGGRLLEKGLSISRIVSYEVEEIKERVVDGVPMSNGELERVGDGGYQLRGTPLA